MAKKTYKQPSLVSGKSVNDILNMDIKGFNRLKESEMRKVVGRLVSAANKRLRRFEKSGISTPATESVKRSGGPFSTKGKDLNALRKEYMRAKGFFESKTSTRKGYEQTKKEVKKGLEKAGVSVPEGMEDKFFKSYEKLKFMSPEVSNRGLKYAVMRELTDAITDETKSADQIATSVNAKLSEIYEEEMRKEMERTNGGVSDFFDFG